MTPNKLKQLWSQGKPTINDWCSIGNAFTAEITIMKALAAGAFGVICPMVNDARQAAEFVNYMRYPPLGQRSFGATRVSFAAPRSSRK